MAAFGIVLGLLASASLAQAQEEHTIRFESVERRLEVYVGAHHVCHTPCERSLPAGGRVRLSFSPHDEAHSAPGRHAALGHDPVSFGELDVLAPRTLRLRWIDRSELRLAGDVVLVAGVTLGALVGGTAIASYDGEDDPLFALGLSGLILMGVSLLVGIPLVVFEDAVHEVN